MIARPLELASRLRPAPRGFDALFYVNVGLIVLFFVLFGSRFVAAAGIPIRFGAEAVQLPGIDGATANARPASHMLVIGQNGILYDVKGIVFPEDLDGWLRSASVAVPDPSLLIVADRRVPYGSVIDLAARARRAGFESVVYAANETESPSP